MKIKKIAVASVISLLGVAAAYPHVEGYIKSLPQKMSKEQAAQRYLKVICPANAVNDRLAELDKKLEEETSKYYYRGPELDRANARAGALSNNIISVQHRLKEAYTVAARELMNPNFIWPAEVQKDIEELADEHFRFAGYLAEHLKGGELDDFKFGNSPDTIRRKLNLPIRGAGCPSSQSK